MIYKKAVKIAQKYKELFFPFCERIEIAGSIRREKPIIGDIELVVIPKKITKRVDLFKDAEIVSPEFISLVSSFEKIKGEPTGKYTQCLLPEGIKLDIFIATPENWGFILAIRTGSAAYSHKILGTAWVKKGYHSENGTLCKFGLPVAVPEEEDLFRILELPFLHPRKRTYKGL